MRTDKYKGKKKEKINEKFKLGVEAESFLPKKSKRKVAHKSNSKNVHMEKFNQPKPSDQKNKHGKASSEEMEAYLSLRENSKTLKNDNLSKKELKQKQKEDKKTEKQLKKEKTGGRRGCLKAFIVFVLFCALVFAGGYLWLNSKVGKMQKVETSWEDFDISKEADKNLNNFRNIAILGVDSRKGQGFEGARSDAIIIASINKDTSDVNLISIMRDTYIPMKNLNGEDTIEKITHAHAYGGAKNTCKSINRAMDLNIYEFIVMDWNSVADTVDAMGGITIDIKPNEIRDLNHYGPETAANTDKQWTPIYNTGKQVLDGVQVATYCRIRKTSGGDTGRTDRMKNVIRALLSKAKSNPGDIDNAIDAVMPQIQTNMGTSDFVNLIPKLANFDIKNNIGWPYNYYGGMFEGAWVAIPKTYETNIKQLYEQAFGIKDYTLTNRAQKINDNIVNTTGVQADPEDNTGV